MRGDVVGKGGGARAYRDMGPATHNVSVTIRKPSP